LRDPSGGSVSDVAWNPEQGLHMVTASGDDRNPVIKMWDLRSSTSLPLATLQGHTEGVLSVSWCPTDPSFLLSCAKDNRTLLWDLYNLQPVYELPSKMAKPHASQSYDESDHQIFGNIASSVGQRRYHVSWSPCLPAVVSACSFDRRVQFYSLSGAKSRIGRAPKWLRRPCGAAFGFGGKLVSFDCVNVTTGADGKKAAQSTISVSQVTEDPQLVEACDKFHAAISSGGFRGFCEAKSANSSSDKERQVWDLMKVICFEKNAREELLSHLGFKSGEIAAAAEKYVKKMNPKTNSPDKNSNAGGENMNSTFTGDGSDATEVFGSPPLPVNRASDVASPVFPIIDPNSTAVQTATAAMIATAIAGEEAEETIRHAIVVGNFPAAVDCCLSAGLLAEALILAQCGDQSLWSRTQEAFFEKQRSRHLFLNILHSVIKSNLMGMVMSSDLGRWRETLAVLSTYGKSEEFPKMCAALASRLETEINDTDSATLCYMCAANVESTVNFWTAELKAANMTKGSVDTRALQEYVEKVVVFSQANSVNDLGPDCANFFAEYASLLASQGRFDIALGYLKGANLRENILIDRLYNAGTKPVGSRPPAFPFERITVNTKVVTQQQQQQQQPAQGARTPGAGAATPASNVSAKPTPQTANPQMQAQQSQAQAQAQSQQYGQQAQGYAQQGAFGQPQPQSQSQQQLAAKAEPVLPPGWAVAADPGSGRPYYFNHSTGQSQWDPPAAPVAAQPIPQPAVPSIPSATPSLASSFPQPQAQQPNIMNQSAASPMNKQQQPSIMQVNQPNSVRPGSATAPAPAPAPSPAPAAAAVAAAQPVGPIDSPAVQYLGQVIANVTGKSYVRCFLRNRC
jgi:protein transport protein SEC31